ncbi:MAG: LPS-assembly protein LptD [Deltaproteobacteria bacterium]|nr:LPS-assembly protein LptD [Deltaproteobacteria bacterium]
MRGPAAILLIFAFIAVGISEGVYGADPAALQTPVTIQADSLSYESDNKRYRAEGNVEVSYDGGRLTADKIIYEESSGSIDAEGSVELTKDGDVLSAGRATYNVLTERALLTNGQLFFHENHLYITGSTIARTADQSYYATDATVSSCDGARPDWRFSGKEVDVTVDGYGFVKDMTFQVKNVPVLYLPYLIFPAKTTRQSGLLFPRITYSQDKHGWDIVLPFYWAFSDSADATFYQRYMDKRGFQEGVEVRYVVGDRSFGTVYGDWLRDNKKVIEVNPTGLERSWTDGEDRWSWYVNHETSLPSGWFFRTDLRKVSDPWYFRDFESYNYYLDHYLQGEEKRFGRVSFLADESLPFLDSSARLVKDWPAANLTVFAQYADNLQSDSNDGTLQRYPEIAVTVPTRSLFGPSVLFAVDSLYNNFYRTEGYRGQTVDVRPTFSATLGPDVPVQLMPYVTIIGTAWDSSHSDGISEDMGGSRGLFTAGVRASTEIFRIFDAGFGGYERLKHSVKPEVEYRYTPLVGQDDRPDFVDEIGSSSDIIYSLLTTLIGRNLSAGVTSYRELLRLKISQTYNCLESTRSLRSAGDERRPLGDIFVDLTIDPCRYAVVNADFQIDAYSGDWNATNCYLAVSDARGDVLSAEYRYSRSSIEEVNLSARVRIVDALDASYIYRRSLLEDRTLDQSYGLEIRRQCWSLSLIYSDQPGDRRYMLMLNLLGLGTIGEASARAPSF